MLNKRILLTGVLSIAAIAGMVYLHNNILYPEQGEDRETPPSEAESREAAPDSEEGRGGEGFAFIPLEPVEPPEGDAHLSTTEEEVVIDTDVYTAVLSTKGGVLTSLTLKEYEDYRGRPAEMILGGESGIYPFEVGFAWPGEHTSGEQAPEEQKDISGNTLFSLETDPSAREATFSREFEDPRGNRFIMKKTYSFVPDEYIFRLSITISPRASEEGGADYADGYMYNLTLGPRLGPPAKNIDGRIDYRYFTLLGDAPKKKNYLGDEDKLREISEDIKWAGIHGQYFAGILHPAEEVPLSTLYLDSRKMENTESQSTLNFHIPWEGKDAREDVFYCFFGPKKPSILSKYSDKGSNAFSLEGAEFTQLENTGSILGKLSEFFGMILQALKVIARNYGVAIILFALLVRVISSPLSYRNFRSNKKIMELQPKIEKIRKKHEFNKAESTRQIMDLYQKENINSFGRVLPLLIQLPIIVALFHHFSKSFSFRNAVFIPGWIADLSTPDMIGELPFFIPLLGTSLRVLPFLMLAVTIVQTRINQPPVEAGRMQKIMVYATPILIFLILYNMPSGLVLYWLFYNLLGLGEHILFERRYAADEAQAGAPADL